MKTSLLALVLIVPLAGVLQAAPDVVNVADDATLKAALAKARPGTQVRIAAGRYRPGVWVENLSGTAESPIVIAGQDAEHPPLFEGGAVAWHLSGCSYVTLRDLDVRGQSGNGINIDNGGQPDKPSHGIAVERIRVSDIGPKGNHDPIKLSGLDDFVVRDCVVTGWAGQAVDMVGCHRGLIEGCQFLEKSGFSPDSGPQCKGGTSQVVIRRCLFQNAGTRGVNIGGSTGLNYFRPPDAKYEAKDILVEGCTLVGSQAPLAFVGVDGAVAEYNTIYHPGKWVLRILQETNEPGFVPCRNGRFEHNLIVFRRAEVQVLANIGPGTRPETFTFANNLWFCEDRPAASKPTLPSAEAGGVYGVDPRLSNLESNQFRPGAAAAAAFGATAWKPELPR